MQPLQEGAPTAKKPPAMQEPQVRSLGREYPLKEEMQPIPIFLPGEPAGKAWGCRHRERTCEHSRGRRGWDGLRK